MNLNVASFSSTLRYTKALTACTRGAVSASSQRMSSAATKCQVGLITCVRRMDPSLKAWSSAKSVASLSR